MYEFTPFKKSDILKFNSLFQNYEQRHYENLDFLYANKC